MAGLHAMQPSGSKPIPCRKIHRMWIYAFRVTVFVGAFLGFIFQATTVSSQYFKYETRTQVYVQIPEKAVYHNIALCISYIDLMDAIRLKKETGIEWKKMKLDFSNLYSERPVSIHQVFNYTPEAENAIDSCVVRTNDWMFKPMLGRDCQKHFNVTKFLTLEFMCYGIKPNNHPAVELSFVTQSLYFPFTMFEVGMQSSFSGADFVNLVAYTGNYPFVSRNFASLASLSSGPGAKNKTYNFFSLFFSDYSIKQLPAPFDTRCRNLSTELQFTCKYDCLVRRYKSLKMMPVNSIIPDPLDYQILGYKDLQDPDILALVSKNDRECQKECFFSPCLQQYTKTTVEPSFLEGEVLRLGLRSPVDPDIETEAVPVMRFFELFSFLCSCFGTWFGISFMTMDHFRHALFRAPASRSRKSKLAKKGDSFPAIDT